MNSVTRVTTSKDINLITKGIADMSILKVPLHESGNNSLPVPDGKLANDV